MKKILFLLLVGNYLVLHAQHLECRKLNWFRDSDYNVNFLNEVSNFCIDSSNNKYIVSFFEQSFEFGMFNNNTNYKRGVFLAKYNADDSLIFVKKIGEGTFVSRNCIPISVNYNSEIVLGFNINELDTLILLNHQLNANGKNDIILLKLDSIGNYINHIQESNNYSIRFTSNKGLQFYKNNLYFSGSFNCDTSVPTQTCSTQFHAINLSAMRDEGLLIKYDSSLTPIWAKSMGGSGSDMVESICIDENENIYILGRTNSEYVYFDSIIVAIPYYPATKLFFTKYNSNGEALWSRFIAELGHLVATAIDNIIVKGNGVFVSTTGNSNNNLNNIFVFQDGNTLQANSAGWNSVLCRYDTNGNYKWARITNGGFYQMFNSLNVHNNYIFVSGEYSEELVVNNDTIYSINNGNDAFVLKLDTLGETKLFRTVGGVGVDLARLSEFDHQNNLYMLGITNSYPFYIDNEVIFPSLPAVKFFAKFTESVPLSFENLPPSPFTIYPNPAENEFIISSPNALQATIILQNTMGQTLQTKKINGTSQSIETGNLPNGIYFLQIKNENTYYTHKIIIQH